MWVLRTAENAEFPFMFRILPGNIKTVGDLGKNKYFAAAVALADLSASGAK